MQNGDAGLQVGMPPIWRGDARILFLGSLPGETSIALGQYFAHPRNQFWRLLGGAMGCDLAAMDYAERVPALYDHGVALWDVVGTARRRGSADATLRDCTLNPVNELIAALPALRLVAFNGSAAARFGQELDIAVSLRRLVLPSSSAANRWPLSRKQDAWNALRSHFAGGREAEPL